MNFTNSKKYSEVQCIAFSMPTGTSHNDYLGNTDDYLDMASKLNIVKETIESAARNKEVNNKEKCLKVFMLPEFFFRGGNGAYKIESIPTLTEGLRNLVNDPKYKDWLFVFGTTVTYSDGEQKQNAIRNAEIYNYSFIQKGNSDEDKSFIVMKDSISGCDFINTVYPTTNSDRDVLSVYNTQTLTHAKNTKSELRNEEKNFNYDSFSIFEIDGIRIGVEICLDHILRRLDKYSPVDKAPLDLHLVTSSGVVTKFKSPKRLSKKGISFICDGANQGYSCVIKSNLRSVSPLKSYDFSPSNVQSFKKAFSSSFGKIQIFKPHNIEKNLNLMNI